MQENHDPDVVVMGRKVYDELINRATWDSAPGNHLTRHMCKYNSVLRAERKAKLIEEREKFNKLKHRAQALVNEFGGKTTYHAIRWSTGWYFSPIKPLFVGKGKITVVCRDCNNRAKAYHINQITGVLPNDVQPLHDGYFLPNDGQPVQVLELCLTPK